MNKVKNFIQSKKVQVMSLATTAMVLIPQVAHAEEVDIAGSMTTALNSVVSNTLAAIAAVAPIGITIFGATFAWKKGVAFFSTVGKKG